MLPQSVKTRGIHAAVRFAPAATLNKEHKQKFQIKSNEGFDWQRQEYADNVWRLTTPQTDGDRRSQLKLTLQPDSFTFEDSFPTGPLDLFSDNLKLVMDCVASVFSPQFVLAIGAVVRLTAQSDPEDARVFLGNRCLMLDDRLKPLGRPVHGVGLKMLLPPVAAEGGPNWQATIKVETLIEDVRQLFIEVDARWGQPTQWNSQAIVDRVNTAHQFATTEVVDFLHKLGRER